MHASMIARRPREPVVIVRRTSARTVHASTYGAELAAGAARHVAAADGVIDAGEAAYLHRLQALLGLAPRATAPA